MILRQGIGLLSSQRATGKLLILTYHRVLENYDPVIDEIDADHFRQQMETLSKYFNVVSLAEGVERLQAGTLGPGSVCITFDDGYRDNYDVALPILSALNLPATFFIATGYLGNGIMWNDVIIESIRKTSLQYIDLREFGLDLYDIKDDEQRTRLVGMLLGMWKYKPVEERNYLAKKLNDLALVKLDERIMMTEEEVCALSRSGMEIGGHTVNHPILTCANSVEVKEELSNCKSTLESLLGRGVRFFAYPNGQSGKDYNLEHANAVENAGFCAALTTNNGCIDKKSNLFELPRVSINHITPFRFGSSLARGYVQY